MMAAGMLSVKILYQILNWKFAFHALIKEEKRKIFTGELNVLATTVLQTMANTCIILCLYLLVLRKQVTLSATTCNSVCTCVKFNYYTWSISLRADRNWSHWGISNIERNMRADERLSHILVSFI
jgi:hypothetical protein